MATPKTPKREGRLLLFQAKRPLTLCDPKVIILDGWPPHAESAWSSPESGKVYTDVSRLGFGTGPPEQSRLHPESTRSRSRSRTNASPSGLQPESKRPHDTHRASPPQPPCLSITGHIPRSIADTSFKTVVKTASSQHTALCHRFSPPPSSKPSWTNSAPSCPVHAAPPQAAAS